MSDARLLNFPRHGRADGFLTVFEAESSVPFPIRRVFLVSADAGATRGRHAHRQCAQLLVCASGRCRVVYHDGTDERTATLEPTGQGLHLPPGLWAEQHYETPGTVLAVFCDLPYDEDDYIRDWEAFIGHRRRMTAQTS